MDQGVTSDAAGGGREGADGGGALRPWEEGGRDVGAITGRDRWDFWEQKGRPRELLGEVCGQGMWLAGGMGSTGRGLDRLIRWIGESLVMLLEVRGRGHWCTGRAGEGRGP